MKYQMPESFLSRMRFRRFATAPRLSETSSGVYWAIESHQRSNKEDFDLS